MEKRYKEIDGVRYQVIQNTILGSNVVPVGESLPEVTVSDSGKVLTVNASGEWEAAAPGGGGSGGNVINLEENLEHALNMKYSDIVDALNEHKQIIVWVNASTWGSEEYPSDILRAFVLACMPSSGFYKVKALMYDVVGDGTAKVLEYVATTEDGYPVFLAG